MRPVTNQNAADARDCVRSRIRTQQRQGKCVRLRIRPLAETGGARAGTTRVSKAANDNGLQGQGADFEFDVTQANGREIIIDINGTRNKLSGSNAAVSERQHAFYLHFDAHEAQTLHIEKEHKRIRSAKPAVVGCWIFKAVLQSRDVWEPDTDVSHAGRGEVFRGRIDMRRAFF